MPKHGFARGMDFTVTDQTADSISLELSSNEETKKSYPFDWKKHRLEKCCQRQTVNFETYNRNRRFALAPRGEAE